MSQTTLCNHVDSFKDDFSHYSSFYFLAFRLVYRTNIRLDSDPHTKNLLVLRDCLCYQITSANNLLDVLILHQTCSPFTSAAGMRASSSENYRKNSHLSPSNSPQQPKAIMLPSTMIQNPSRDSAKHSQVRTTIFPSAQFSSIHLCASTISSSLKTFKIFKTPPLICSTNSPNGVTMKSSGPSE